MWLYDNDMNLTWQAIADHGELTEVEKKKINFINDHANMTKEESYKSLYDTAIKYGSSPEQARIAARNSAAVINHIRDLISEGKIFHMIYSMDNETMDFIEGPAPVKEVVEEPTKNSPIDWESMIDLG